MSDLLCITKDCGRVRSQPRAGEGHHGFCSGCWELVPQFYRRELPRAFRPGADSQTRVYRQHLTNARLAVENVRRAQAANLARQAAAVAPLRGRPE